MNTDITIVIHTHNEEKNIRLCLESARQLTDNIILIDMESTDHTVEIGKLFSITVLNFPNHHYVEPSREFGIQQVTTPWLFILDADERLTHELTQEIKEIIKSPEYQYYQIPRKEIVFNQWLKHGGWWPNYQTRLIKKGAFVHWPKAIHSHPEIKGKGGFTTNSLLHYSQNDFSEIVNKTLVFEDMESELLFQAHKKSGIMIFFRKFFGELFRRLVRRGGILDGQIGIMESIYQAYSKTITYLFLYEKQHPRS